ncbi:uncharacterized protein PgNI_12472 [Pyricularia grisea]|uniref:Major facilitator superfamily (MFS) profile domain-containing protein n=1 Tax=Pyricularia grisea TaxID=148305 RepID=A0A6P8AML0_PYRGI|nr:uncharacterized protein PgNI_12472 [Pyricularia grisea]TLD03261.1 hypothetical protein PgNI_12472 [Pyricularia grisea]
MDRPDGTTTVITDRADPGAKSLRIDGEAAAARMEGLESPTLSSLLSPPQPPHNRAVTPLLVLVLLVNLSASLYQLPLNRVIERRICRDFFRNLVDDGSDAVFLPDGQVREQLCKVSEVQQDLARVQRGMDLAWIIGDLIMTIPLGFVAERHGRRLVLLLNLVPRIAMLAWAVVIGYFENVFPARLLYLAPMLSVLGGDCVFNSITYAFAAGLTEDNVLRASYFGYMSSITYVVALVGPAFASATMSLNLWLPFLIGISLLFLASRVIPMLPDSRHDQRQEESLANNSTSSFPKFHAHQPVMQAIVHRLNFLYAFVASRPRNFAFLLISMFLTSLASADTKLLVQYISQRYTWSFSSAGYLLSAKACVNFVLLTVVVPSLLRARAKKTIVSAERQNLFWANVCLVMSVMGATLIGLAPTVWLLVPAMGVYALGSALPVFTLSLLKSPQVSPVQQQNPKDDDEDDDGDDDDNNEYNGLGSPTSVTGIIGGGRLSSESHDTTVFSVVMLVKTVGSLVGVPIVTSLWIVGIDLRFEGLGLPYFVSAGCYFAALVVLFRINVI